MVYAEGARVAKTALWSIRIVQLLLAIVLLGSLSYIIDEIRDFGFRGGPFYGYRHRPIPSEVIAPEAFSILAIVFTSFGIAAVFFFGYYSILAAAALDFVICIGYIISIALLRHNFPDGDGTPLEKYLNFIRRRHGMSNHERLNGNLVKLVVGFIVIQIILYFFTIIASMLVARKSKQVFVEKDHPLEDQKELRASFSKESRVSSENTAVPAAIV